MLRIAQYATVALYFLFPITLAGANLAMAVVLGAWLLAGNYRARWQAVRHNPIALSALGLYAVVLLGILYSPAPWPDIGQHLGKYFKLVFLVLAMSLLTEPHWCRRCWAAFTAAMLVTLACTYVDIWVDLPWSATRGMGWGADHTIFKDYISQGIMISMFVLIALSQAINIELNPRIRWLWAALAVLGTLSITHLSEGRTGYIGLAAALLGFALFAWRGRHRWALLLAVAVAGAGLYASSHTLQGRVAQAFTEAREHNLENQSSIGQRLYFAEKSWQLISERPVLGWGTGAYHQQFCRVADSAAWCSAGRFHPHNQVLFLWVEHGLPGLALVLALIALPLWRVRRQIGSSAVLSAGFAGVFLVGSVTHGSLWLSTESHFFTLMLGLLAASSSPSH